MKLWQSAIILAAILYTLYALIDYSLLGKVKWVENIIILIVFGGLGMLIGFCHSKLSNKHKKRTQ